MTRPWRALPAISLSMALLALLGLLTACDAGTQGVTTATAQGPGGGQPTATAGANAPMKPSHTSASCTDAAATIAGDLRISPTALGYGQPIFQVPDGTPLTPLALPVHGSNGQAPRDIPTWFSPAGDSPPDLLVTICNSSATQAHEIESVSVKLSAFTPHSGGLGVWDPCDGTYTRPAGFVATQCGEGAAVYDEYVRATFASDAQVGASVPASLVDTVSSTSLGPLPASLPPGQSMQVAVFVGAPAAAGVYTFAVGITADQTMLPFTAGQKLLLAPIAHRWTGKACLSNTMQAAIPANPPVGTYYICPES